jgi:hypothetical protein
MFVEDIGIDTIPAEGAPSDRRGLLRRHMF